MAVRIEISISPEGISDGWRAVHRPTGIKCVYLPSIVFPLLTVTPTSFNSSPVWNFPDSSVSVLFLCLYSSRLVLPSSMGLKMELSGVSCLNY